MVTDSSEPAVRILSIDVEEWFHQLDYEGDRMDGWERHPSRVEATTDLLLGRCDHHGAKGTFFMLGWVAERHPSLVQRIQAQGHEIGTHSFAHTLVHRQTPAGFRADLRRSLRLLEDITGAPIRSYRAPGFSITPSEPWALDILVEEGIRTDSSLFPGFRAHGGMPHYAASAPHRIATPSGDLHEFPISTTGLGPLRLACAGGGYFRLLPFPAMQGASKHRSYLMTYFHPRDFDPDHPEIPGLSPIRRWRARVGLRGSMEKLDRMLAWGGFTSLAMAESRVDWDSSPQQAPPSAPASA